MIKLDGKITGNQIKKRFDEVLKIAKETDGYIPGVSAAWGICLENIEVISDKIAIDFEANVAEDMISWDKVNPVWSINIVFIQTGKIYQVRPETYDWDLKKSFDKVARLIKKEIL